MISKYQETVLDGRWKFKRWVNGRVIFENIFNHQEVMLTKRQLDSVLEGRITVSKIVSKRIHKATPGYWARNKF